MESTYDPPASYASSERGRVTVGIHLKYKTGDIFKLAINSSQHSQYFGKVTEILDTSAKIGWRCEIELIDRFANTNGGALPSTIERISAYTPLVTTNFNGNLDATVNNLQAFADAVDDMTVITEDVQTQVYAAGSKTSLANSDLFAVLDSAASWALKNIPFANVAASIKSLFASYYATIDHAHDGWIAITDAWTRTGNNTFTVPGNVTGQYLYQPGMKVKVTDSGGTVYGVIESAVYTTLTTITLIDNDDYALSAGSLSSPYVSNILKPSGFPEWFNYTPTIAAGGSMTVSNVTIAYAKWKTHGKTMQIAIQVSSFDLGGSASQLVTATYPGNVNALISEAGMGAARDNGSGPYPTGAITFSNANVIYVRKYDVSNWALSTARALLVNGVFEWT